MPVTPIVRSISSTVASPLSRQRRLQPANTVPNAVCNIQRVPIRFFRPRDRRSFIGTRNLVRQRTETPDQIVMQVKRFVLFARNAVDIDTGQSRGRILFDPHHRFFTCFPRGRRSQRSIRLLDVAARQQPPMQPVMIHKQYFQISGMEHQRGTGHVPWGELIARKRSARLPQKIEGQFRALPCQSVRARIELFDNPASLRGSHCAGVFSSWSLVQARSGSS